MSQIITIQLSIPEVKDNSAVNQSRRVIEVFDDLVMAGEDINEVEELSFELIQELLLYLMLLKVDISKANQKYLEVS